MSKSPLSKKNIAEEAVEIVMGARRKSYGEPFVNHSRTAKLWSAYLGIELTPEQVCYLNILQKISRSMQIDKRDNGVDIVGFALNVELIKQSRGEIW